MATMTIRLPDEDKDLIRAYAEIHGMSAAEVLRRSALERIEDEFDLKELKQAIADSQGIFCTLDQAEAMLADD
ncbi:MAG: DUF6290 family protein [Bifidobacteriaceae bacterium]|jgi:hypothetical protein|nr:DUF6290 family protein [Bifidobacteriaceae bacterium]